MTQTGPEQSVFDWSTMSCEPLDLPDGPARAFRDSSGNVQLLASHYETRRMIGPSLDDLRHDCRVVFRSPEDPDPSHYQDRDWITAPYTPDGSTVYAMMSNEYQGFRHPGQCPSPFTFRQCWQNFLTMSVSTDGGNSYSLPLDESPLVASIPYQYTPGNNSPYGVFGPSNVIQKPDGYYYMLAKVPEYGLQPAGVCLLRTNDLADTTSWRAWDGAGFNTTLADPYSSPAPSPAAHVCQPIGSSEITFMSDSLTYNTYFGKYLLVGTGNLPDPTTGNDVWGFYYSLSDDLINWTPRKLLLQGVVVFNYSCGAEEPLLYPSILDPNSTSRNFDTSGQSPYLYFVRIHYLVNSSTSCFQLLDRDLGRVPFQFTSTGAAAAAASFKASSDPAPTGSSVVFDGSSTRTIDDSKATYRWDLDGNGTFETTTGATSMVRHSYDRAGNVTVRLRVTDEFGQRMQATRQLEVTNCDTQAQPCGPGCRRHGRRRCGTR